MKILITGATGLVGRYLARSFSELGEIYGLKRSDSQIEDLDIPTIQWRTGDITDYQSLEVAFEGMDVIIHAAALVSYESKDADRLMKINVEGTTNVVNVMLDQGIKKLIHISSVAALGRSPELTEIDETHKWIASPLNTPYAISKYHADLEVWRGAQEGLSVMVLYPSVVLGKIADNRSSTQMYNYVLEENKYYPKGTVNYIDVRDLSAATVKLYQAGRWGEHFILSAGAISYKAFFEELAKAFDKKAPYKPVTAISLKLLLFFTKIAKAFSINKLPLSPQTAMLAQRKFILSNKKLISAIDYEFHTLQNTLKWARRNDS
ncbi:NAD-dependent epimerase/dehydratase family protein [Belliella pelovolcani]|uniref:Nucleoside-diphosphate-sugar epimerase n=1 Tax=Belliella pelovolcani TaxID=529505 RepID=A0A1N7KGV3_9BACT|nr:NAD-dependent epimerase/dehydratase family protein [Belliella pelovolcani]SIS60828.1 Nucleoside-diphosphate-sugar epimerase [Belliella pelovolcani]